MLMRKNYLKERYREVYIKIRKEFTKPCLSIEERNKFLSTLFHKYLFFSIVDDLGLSDILHECYEEDWLRGSKELIDIKSLKECRKSVIHTMTEAIGRVSDEDGCDILESILSDDIASDFLECYYECPINRINTDIHYDVEQNIDDALYITIGKSKSVAKILLNKKIDTEVYSMSEGYVQSYEDLFVTVNKLIHEYKTQNIYLNIIDIDGLNVTKQKILELCPAVRKEDNICGNFITDSFQPSVLLKQSVSLTTPANYITKQVKDWIGDIFSEAFLLENDMINNKPQVVEDEKRLCIVGIYNNNKVNSLKVYDSYGSIDYTDICKSLEIADYNDEKVSFFNTNYNDWDKYCVYSIHEYELFGRIKTSKEYRDDANTLLIYPLMKALYHSLQQRCAEIGVVYKNIKYSIILLDTSVTNKNTRCERSKAECTSILSNLKFDMNVETNDASENYECFAKLDMNGFNSNCFDKGTEWYYSIETHKIPTDFYWSFGEKPNCSTLGDWEKILDSKDLIKYINPWLSVNSKNKPTRDNNDISMLDSDWL